MTVNEWERCRPWIEAALAHDASGRTIGDVRKAIETGSAILLAGEKSAMVLDVLVTRTLNVWLAGGDLNEIRSADPQLVEAARAFDCGQITIMGRKGWGRALRDLGYEVLVYKEIDDGEKAA